MGTLIILIVCVFYIIEFISHEKDKKKLKKLEEEINESKNSF